MQRLKLVTVLFLLSFSTFVFCGEKTIYEFDHTDGTNFYRNFNSKMTYKVYFEVYDDSSRNYSSVNIYDESYSAHFSTDVILEKDTYKGSFEMRIEENKELRIDVNCNYKFKLKIVKLEE